MTENKGSIDMSIEEFNRLQREMMSLKNENFELKQKFSSSPNLNEVRILRKSKQQMERELKRLKNIFHKSKNRKAFQELENERNGLKLQVENREKQVESMKKNIRIVYQENEKLKSGIDKIKKEKEKLQLSLVEMINKRNTTVSRTGGNDPHENEKNEKKNFEDPLSTPPQRGDSKNEENKMLLETIKSLKEKHEKSAGERERTIANLRDQNKVLHEKSSKVEEVVKSLRKDKLKLSLRLKGMIEKLESVKKENISIEKDLLRKFNSKKREMELSMMRKNENETKKLKTKIAKLIETVNFLTEKKQKYKLKKKRVLRIIETLNVKNEKLERNLKKLENEKKKNFVEKEKFDSLILELKNIKQRNHASRKLVSEYQRRVKLLEKNTKKNYGFIVKNFADSILKSVIIRTTSNELQKTKLELGRYRGIDEECVNLKEANRDLEMRIEDKELEKVVAQKTNVKKIKELQNYLVGLRGKIKSYEENKGTDSEGGRGRIKHVRTMSQSSYKSTSSRKSNSSNTTTGKGSSEKITKYIQFLQKENEQLQGDNENLINKLTKMQQENWGKEDKIRLFEKRILDVEENLDKKKMIIQDYIKREKFGRLTPEVERVRKNMGEKKGSFMGKIFKSNMNFSPIKTKNSPSKNEFQSQLQLVIEETLLKNIQLQKNLKIMGDEVERLLKENKILRKK